MTLLPSVIVLALWITGAILVRARMRQLEKRRADRARRRRIRRYVATLQPTPSNVVPLDTYSRKVKP